MSFNVLVVPEDPKLNGHILKPLVERILQDAGKPNAKVRVMDKPRVRGYGQAINAVRDTLPNRYRSFDLCLFLPDADSASTDAMNHLEADLGTQGITLFCCPAQPEVEIYACVAFRNELPETWEGLRTHPRLKEAVFEPLRSGLDSSQRRAPGGGRRSMIERSLRNLRRLYQLCPETKQLRDRIAALVQSREA